MLGSGGKPFIQSRIQRSIQEQYAAIFAPPASQALYIGHITLTAYATSYVLLQFPQRDPAPAALKLL
jgi:hypothetical protein